jgi:hypothetical protein
LANVGIHTIVISTLASFPRNSNVVRKKDTGHEAPDINANGF